MPERWILPGDVLRYARRADSSESELDKSINFHHRTAGPAGSPSLQLESGIDAAAAVIAIDGPRRPVVMIRSSPWKARTRVTPWEDRFAADSVVYYGDHRPETFGDIGATNGNKLFPLYTSDSPEERLKAPPMMIFKSVPGRDGRGRKTEKGFVEFLGVGLPTRLETVSSRAPYCDEKRDFKNLEVHIAGPVVISRCQLEMDQSPSLP